MFTHYVRLFCPSSLVVTEAQIFPFVDSEITVWDSWHDQVHEGLNFSIYLTATDLYSALKKSLPTIMPLANMLAVTHATAIGNPRVLFGLDLDNTVADRQFGQVIYNVPSSWLRRRMFDKNAFAKLWTTFSSPKVGSARMQTVNSGMFHYRKSLQASTYIDEFLELYSGLESLNRALQNKHNLPTTDTRHCKCGQPITTPIASGIKYAIINLAEKRSGALSR